MFEEWRLKKGVPAYLQLRDYLKEMILEGVLAPGVKLPSTRELSSLAGVSRNTVILAYQYLEDDGLLQTVRGRGTFVTGITTGRGAGVTLDWTELLTDYAVIATELDIEKKEARWQKGMISFKSIAPDPELFEAEEFKKAFLRRFALEGQKLLNYGYAQGYRDLLNYLRNYLKGKGVPMAGKDLLITNGFTEAFDITLTALTKPGAQIICENPTHNTAIKIMRLHGLEVTGVPMEEDGLNLEELEKALAGGDAAAVFLIPSYHNPTGVVMSPEKRVAVLKLLAGYRVPVIEDGFNEELRYSGSHVAPLAALAGQGNNLIYTGSFSKILFPGLRIGWILADRELISCLESIKRSRNIHTSFLDQAILYEYLQSGRFERYLKNARRVYRERHEKAVELAEKYIPAKRIWGQGGLHVFIELPENLNARQVLAEALKRNVIFMPGDIFYTDGGGHNTFRLGISRVNPEEMEEGFKIIGEIIDGMKRN